MTRQGGFGGRIPIQRAASSIAASNTLARQAQERAEAQRAAATQAAEASARRAEAARAAERAAKASSAQRPAPMRQAAVQPLARVTKVGNESTIQLRGRDGSNRVIRITQPRKDQK